MVGIPAMFHNKCDFLKWTGYRKHFDQIIIIYWRQLDDVIDKDCNGIPRTGGQNER